MDYRQWWCNTWMIPSSTVNISMVYPWSIHLHRWSIAKIPLVIPNFYISLRSPLRLVYVWLAMLVPSDIWRHIFWGWRRWPGWPGPGPLLLQEHGIFRDVGIIKTVLHGSRHKIVAWSMKSLWVMSGRELTLGKTHGIATYTSRGLTYVDTHSAIGWRPTNVQSSHQKVSDNQGRSWRVCSSQWSFRRNPQSELGFPQSDYHCQCQRPQWSSGARALQAI